jgi:hypothetical protein
MKCTRFLFKLIEMVMELINLGADFFATLSRLTEDVSGTPANYSNHPRDTIGKIHSAIG